MGGVAAVVATAIASCSSAGTGAAPAGSGATASASASASARATGGARTSVPRDLPAAAKPGSPLPRPAPLTPFTGGTGSQDGQWRAAGRPVNGSRAVYTTTLTPPGGSKPAGIAWMDTTLLSARLYSGSISPGGGPYRFTAPILPAQAATLVAAFNGGFQMNAARGGYYTQGRTVVPLRRGAASLVIYANGNVAIGAWDAGVTMTPDVASVRQNLTLLVAGGRPAPYAATRHWLHAWGNTCGATSCAASVPGIEHQWRSGAGVTADGALVYVCGPALDPLQLAQLLVRAGAVRGMELDINPDWPVFVSYDPLSPGGLAAPANGTKLLPGTVQGPSTFFEPTWARDFITMSGRRLTGGHGPARG